MPAAENHCRLWGVGTTEPGQTRAMTATSPPGPADEPERYVGLETGEAERQARSRGWRILRSVPPGAMVTMEFRPGRLNFEVQADRVKRAWQG